MAFWTSVGQPYPAGCGITNIQVAQNTTNLSNHILTKRVSIGFSGIPNVIAYQVTFHVAEHHSSAIFESLTGYLTRDFSRFWTFDPATGSLASLSYGPGEQDKPIIFSTPAQNYAMGIYSPGLPEPSFPGLGYARYSYLSQFTVQKVGGAEHLEYWIPAEKLGEFNQSIVGKIEVISEFHGK